MSESGNGSVAVLGIDNLVVGYRDARGRIQRVVDDVTLSVGARERLGIVGESGSGKSSLALASLGLARGALVEGSVRVAGTRYQPSLRSMRSIRGSVIGLVLQDPLSALNPVVPIGQQLEEVLTARGSSRAVARERAVTLLDRVGVARARERLRAYPREFSGGMRQRVVIAMALMASPQVLIADEPTTALDLRTQRKVLDLLKQLCDEEEMALVMISHDIDVIADIAQRTVVLYSGQIVEEGSTSGLLDHPGHPYTAGLLASRPELEGPIPARLPSIVGSPPAPGSLTRCCRFFPRCSFAQAICREEEPALTAVGVVAKRDGERTERAHTSRCHFRAAMVAGSLVAHPHVAQVVSP